MSNPTDEKKIQDGGKTDAQTGTSRLDGARKWLNEKRLRTFSPAAGSSTS